MRALVLSGGGARGAYQVGVLRRLIDDERRDYDIITGVSVGALNGAYLAQAGPGKLREVFGRLEGLWDSLTTDKVYKKRLLGDLAGFTNLSIYDSTPLIDLVRRTLDPVAVRSSGRKLRVGAVCLETGEYRSATEDDPRLAWWVAASSSFPVFFLPILIDGRHWTDGGLRNVTPVAEAVRLGATEIDVIVCSNPDVDGEWSATKQCAVPGLLLRTLGILADEVTRTDLQVVGLKNDLARLGEAYRTVTFRLVQPSQPMPDSLDFAAEPRWVMMDMGYADARMLGPLRRHSGNPNA